MRTVRDQVKSLPESLDQWGTPDLTIHSYEVELMQFVLQALFWSCLEPHSLRKAPGGG